jgi:hypothetical protein
MRYFNGLLERTGMAAQTSSVSYRCELSPEMLEHALATAVAPPGFEAHIDYVVMAVEEAADLNTGRRLKFGQTSQHSRNNTHTTVEPFGHEPTSGITVWRLGIFLFQSADARR